MKRRIAEFTADIFDVLIIGGGITGAFLALDAATRGLSTALVEKGDFGAATSSASSKVLHGGIRYLAQGRLLKVRESAFERSHFQALAPHLAHYVPFLIPTYSGFQKSKLLLEFAMAMYEALCVGQNRLIVDPFKKVPRGCPLSKTEICALVPTLATAGVTGGVKLYESHMYSSERMTLSVLETAARHGAILANYLKAESFLLNGSRIFGIRAKDRLTGTDLEVRATLVINAAGPWISLLNNGVRERRANKIISGFAKGVHVITRSLTGDYAVALPTTEKKQGLAVDRGGRHVFIIPWRGRSLVGTSYHLYKGNLDSVHPTKDDCHELIALVNGSLRGNVLGSADILHAYAGLYPLTGDGIDPNTYQGMINYKIIDHLEQDNLTGLLSVLGAKYTTARLAAETALNRVVRRIPGHYRPCQTRNMRLVGGDIHDLDAYRRAKVEQYASLVPGTVAEALVIRYGTEMDRVLALAKDDSRFVTRICPDQDVLAAEVMHAVENEMAHHLDDFVFRRTGLGTLGNPGAVSLERCAALMSEKLGWDGRRVRAELEQTTSGFVSL